MLRMSKLTDYGLVLLTHMAQGGNPAVRTAQELAGCSRVPLPTVSKILKELSKAGSADATEGMPWRDRPSSSRSRRSSKRSRGRSP